MIDCNITKNYFAEKARMTKKDKLGRCRLYCSECLLNNKKTVHPKIYCVGLFKQSIPKKQLQLYRNGRTNIRRGLI